MRLALHHTPLCVQDPGCRLRPSWGLRCTVCPWLGSVSAVPVCRPAAHVAWWLGHTTLRRAPPWGCVSGSTCERGLVHVGQPLLHTPCRGKGSSLCVRSHGVSAGCALTQQCLAQEVWCLRPVLTAVRQVNFTTSGRAHEVHAPLGWEGLVQASSTAMSVFGTLDEDAAAVYLATWVAGGETLASNSCRHRVSSTGGRPPVFGHTVFLQAVP